MWRKFRFLIDNIRYLYLFPRAFRKLFYLHYNRLLLKINGVRADVGVRIYNKFYLFRHTSASIKIGKSFLVTSDDAFNPLSRNIRTCIYAGDKSEIIIGDNVGFSSICLWATHKITIGNHVKVGADSLIFDTDAHHLNYLCRRGADDVGNSAPIVIEDDVLIGTRCVILKGVTIGARCVIGSGSVVTKSIPSDCIAAGNPCKIIRRI